MQSPGSMPPLPLMRKTQMHIGEEELPLPSLPGTKMLLSHLTGHWKMIRQIQRSWPAKGIASTGWTGLKKQSSHLKKHKNENHRTPSACSIAAKHSCVSTALKKRSQALKSCCPLMTRMLLVCITLERLIHTGHSMTMRWMHLTGHSSSILPVQQRGIPGRSTLQPRPV